MLPAIPLHQHSFSGRERAYVEAAIRAGRLMGPGPFGEACERLISETSGGGTAFLVPSCTAALELSALLLDLAPGDEVVMPSFTFVSTANAVVLRGAVPVFVDVDAVAFNLDPDAVRAALTPRTRAVFAVDYAGLPGDLQALDALATEHGIALVEDAAQAYGASRDGRPAGGVARLACFSFHGTKNVTAGEAGALVVNDRDLAGRAAILREKGTDRARFLTGAIESYSWQDVGSSHIVSELTAAFLLAQLERQGEIDTRRLVAWNRYRDALRPLAETGVFALPDPPAEARHNAHIFFLVLADEAARERLRAFLRDRLITADGHYVPLHLSAAGRRFGRVRGSLRNTERAGACLLRLPLFEAIGADQDRVIEAVLDWAASADA
jgi:dTDP-4-amino-4,6-dideoxygalactose transaminase